MAILGTSSLPERADMRRLLIGRPEALAGVVVVLAWVFLLLRGGQGLHHGTTTDPAAMPSMPGMVPSHPPAVEGPWTRAVTQLPQWVLMTVAMMGPVALAGIRHTGRNSLRWRRGRAMTEFAAAYLAVWTAFGAVALAATARLSSLPGTAGLGAVLALAVGWQLSPLKRRCLRSCHHSVPLPLHGWPAERGAALFGLRHGVSCLGTCWCLMLVMIVAPGWHLLWTLALSVAIAVERWAQHPRRASRFVAAGLASAAGGTLALALG
jgi:predicted metal-binding membrane protein